MPQGLYHFGICNDPLTAVDADAVCDRQHSRLLPNKAHVSCIAWRTYNYYTCKLLS